jgi:hypothetical protein
VKRELSLFSPFFLTDAYLAIRVGRPLENNNPAREKDVSTFLPLSLLPYYNPRNSLHARLSKRGGKRETKRET